jgi:hypothetical protein
LISRNAIYGKLRPGRSSRFERRGLRVEWVDRARSARASRAADRLTLCLGVPDGQFFPSELLADVGRAKRARVPRVTPLAEPLSPYGQSTAVGLRGSFLHRRRSRNTIRRSEHHAGRYYASHSGLSDGATVPASGTPAILSAVGPRAAGPLGSDGRGSWRFSRLRPRLTVPRVCEPRAAPRRPIRTRRKTRP